MEDGERGVWMCMHMCGGGGRGGGRLDQLCQCNSLGTSRWIFHLRVSAAHWHVDESLSDWRKKEDVWSCMMSKSSAASPRLPPPSSSARVNHRLPSCWNIQTHNNGSTNALSYVHLSVYDCVCLRLRVGTRNELNMPLRICVRCRDVPQKEAAAPSSGGKRRDTCELVLHVSSSSGTASKRKLDLRAKVSSYGFVEKDGSALEGERGSSPVWMIVNED